MEPSFSTPHHNPTRGNPLLWLLFWTTLVVSLSQCSHEQFYLDSDLKGPRTQDPALVAKIQACNHKDHGRWYFSRSQQSCLPKQFLQFCSTAKQFPEIEALMRALRTELDLQDCSDLAEAVARTNQLHLSHYDLSDLTPLRNLKQLKILRVDHNRIRDLSVIATMDGLELLRADHNHIHDLRPLRKLRKLVTLRLEVNKITQLDGLEDMLSLKYLNLGSNQILQVDTLSQLLGLEKLGLRANPVEDISPLAGLQQLRILDISATNLEQRRGKVKPSQCPTESGTAPAVQQVCMPLVSTTGK
ncbi:MAG: hypothetical protein OXT67_07915 [Zetaproteobacteria bacterium]|nr:hypothetical protein [Zetaproteobacteria bacterium]